MKRTFRFPYAKTTLLVTVLAAAGLYAAVTFNPATQPAMTVSPYTLQTTNLAEVGVEGTRAYRTWYENGAWQGDLIEYSIASSGARSTDVSVGYSPPAYPADGQVNWSTRSVFAAAEGQLADGGTSNPVQYNGISTETIGGVVYNLTDYWKERADSGGRNIFTVAGGSQVPFLWTNLTLAQKTALDSAADPASTDGYEASAVLGFIRGDRRNEYPDGTFRRRYSLQGDSVRSQPVYVAQPVANFTLPYYAAYKAANSGLNQRAGRVYLGANDGMLHAFNASDGSEVFAYIPSMLIGKLPALTARPYTHQYFVDGSLYAGDACPGTCDSADAWKTILTGGLGAGGKGLWALDITDPAYTTSKVLWERRADEASPPTGYTPSHMGYIYNRPQVALMPNGKWYVVTGNGYGSDSGDVVVYLFPLDGTSAPVTYVVEADSGNGLSGLTLVDTDGDFRVEVGYAGDLKGNLHRIDFSGALGDSAPTLADTKLISVGVVSTGSGDEYHKPITTSPDVGRHPNGGYLVYFGTGSLLSSADAGDSHTQSVYAIWDKPGGTYPLTDACDDPATVDVIGAGEGPLLCQTLAEATYTYTYTYDDNGTPVTETRNTGVRYASTQDSHNWTIHRGWRVDLPDTGERVLGSVQLRAERIQLITTNTTVDGIESWLMGLEWLTGGDGAPPKDIMYDLNQDGVLNDSDKVSAGGTAYPPVGLNLGDGNLSQPTIARVSGGVDIHYINGLRLPAPAPSSGPIIGGLIDVTTDSPYGGETTSVFGNTGGMLVDERRCVDFQSDPPVGTDCPAYIGEPTTPVTDSAYDVAGNGYGGLPDGHVHAYDKVHGTPYVDFLSLEPRRGAPRLDAYTGDPDVTDSSSPFYQTTNAEGNPVIHTTYARLDRLGTTDGDEEPYDQAGGPDTLEHDQKFIVVLSNADLSTGGVLQIGCRTWPVQDYQDMITAQLEAGTAPMDLDDDINGVTSSGALVFSLDTIRDDHDPDLGTGVCSEEEVGPGIIKSASATLRILFNNRVVQDLGIMPTLPQCVWGLHDWAIPVDNSAGLVDPAANRVAHVTPVQENNFPRDARNNTGGYRWRNGALVMQMLAVNSDGSSGYALQPPYECLSDCSSKPNNAQYLPVDKQGHRQGGTMASGFRKLAKDGTPLASLNIDSNGLLYEAAIFWDYGDLFGSNGAAMTSCYGLPNAYSRAVQEAVQGIEWGTYTQITDIFFTDGELNQLYYDYLDLVNAVQAAADEAARELALQNLADFFADNPNVVLYDQLRKYVGDKVWQKEQTGQDWRILPIDRSDADNSGSSPDATPEQVDDISRNLTPVLGPNFITGRRTWIDLRP